MTILQPDLPRPEDIESDPVLAILAALDATTTVAIAAIIAAHPRADDYERPYWVKPLPSLADRVAPDILAIARNLLDILQSYRDALLLPHPSSSRDDDDLPF